MSATLVDISQLAGQQLDIHQSLLLVVGSVFFHINHVAIDNNSTVEILELTIIE
jgi:hypothetical protein